MEKLTFKSQNLWEVSKSLFSLFFFLLKTSYYKTSLAKVSDWNSFQTNPKFSDSFRNLYPHQTVSFLSNPKLVFNPSRSEAHSKSIRPCNPIEFGQSELIRINPNFLSEWIRSNRINPKFQSNKSGQFELSIRMNPVYSNQSEWFQCIRFHSDWSN